MNLKISNATVDDVNAICKIENESFSLPWQPDAIQNTILSQNSFVLKASINDEIIGYGSITVICDTADINNIAVSPKYRQKGIGKSILKRLIDISKQKGSNEILLEVRASNALALALYYDSGFVLVGERKGYYDFPKEDALILKKLL